MQEIKPVAWSCAQDWASFQADKQECRLFPNFYWGDDLSADADFAPLYDQQAIDTLRAELERLRMFERDSERYLLITHAEAKEWEDAEARAERAESEAAALRRMAGRDEERLHALEADAEGLRNDAERYRWIRSEYSEVAIHIPGYMWEDMFGESLDIAIDAAKQAQP